MYSSYEKLLEGLGPIEPENGLAERTLAGVALYQERLHKKRLIFAGTMTFASFAALVPAFIYALQGFARTGFYEYFRLLFSDSGIVFSNWQTFGQSLTETFPATEVLLFCGICMLCVFGIRKIIINLQTRPGSVRGALFA